MSPRSRLFARAAAPSVIALAAMLLAVDVASAALITRRLDVTISNETYELDLDEDGEADFRINDRGDGQTDITGISPGANVLNGPFLPFFPALYGPAAFIDVPADRFDPNTFEVYASPTGILSGVTFAPFNFVGTNWFIGVTLGRELDGEPVSTIGFLEITRGSTIVGLVGYSTTPGPITIPVPEPAAALLATVAGAVGLATRRRR